MSTPRAAASDQGLEQLQALTRRPEAVSLGAAVAAARNGDADARAQVVGALLWAGFSAPATIRPLYDLFTATWLDDDATHVDAAALASAGEAPPPAPFWKALEQVLVGPEAGHDAASITAAVAGLGGAVAPAYQTLAEADALTWPGSDDVDRRTLPGFIDLAALGSLPAGTLGRTLHDELVANGYEVEVLDREAIQLGNLPPALRYLNTRILQMHDVWHLVAGYSTGASHEIAISAFQLAQFGHGYSAMFLATVATITHLQQPEGFPVIGLLVAEAWRHGRGTPALMAIDWETLWAEPIERIRETHGIAPYQSLLPANLFELAPAT